jgi:hypothetical protein
VIAATTTAATATTTPRATTTTATTPRATSTATAAATSIATTPRATTIAAAAATTITTTPRATTTATTATTACADVAAVLAVAIAARLHLRHDVGVVLLGQRLVRGRKDLVLALDVHAVLLGESLGDLEQRLAGAGARFVVELLRVLGDCVLQRDLRRVLGGQRGQCLGKLGPARRQAWEDRALLVEEVPRHRALEVGDRVAHDLDVGVVWASCGQPACRLEQLRHHVVVTAVRAVELVEASQ